jgi:hypothetical protein
MLKRSRWLLVAALVVAMAAAAFIVWRGRKPAPSATPGRQETFTVSDVPVESPQLSIGIGTVKWTRHPDYTDWACLVQCREREGCHAEVQLTVEYISGGVKKRLTIGGQVDAGYGETVRIGRAQRPAVDVDRVMGVKAQVLEAFHRGAPTPTPME